MTNKGERKNMGLFSFLSKGTKEERKAKTKEREERELQQYLEESLDYSNPKREGAKMLLFITGVMKYQKYKLDYVGGFFPNPQTQTDAEILLIPQGIMFKHMKTDDVIPFSDIKKVKMRTQQQIESNVTLTRLLAFGMYAFAMKKKQKVFTNYCVLECEASGLEYTVVFGGEHAPALYKQLCTIGLDI